RPRAAAPDVRRHAGRQRLLPGRHTADPAADRAQEGELRPRPLPARIARLQGPRRLARRVPAHLQAVRGEPQVKRSPVVAPPRSDYREYPPPDRLRPWIECFWTRELGAAAPGTHRVLPDGCIDILFEAAGSSAAGLFVVGMMTRPLLVSRAAAASFTG